MRKFVSAITLMLFYTLIIVVFGSFIFAIAYNIGGVEVADYLFLGATAIFCFNFIIIGLKQRNNVKQLSHDDKKKFMIKQVNTLYVFITIAAIALLISVIYKSKYGMIMSVLFMIAFSIWELGAYLGYKSLLRKNA